MKRILLRTSERGSYKTCRQQWFWAYEERLRKKGPPTRALRFGDLVHQALAIRYPPGRKRGPHPAQTYVRLYREQIEAGVPAMRMREDTEEGDPRWIDPEEFGVDILTRYVNEYGKDERYRIIQPEQAFQLDIFHPRNGRYLFTYVSQLDAVVEDFNTGKLGFFEHKTTSSSTMEPFGAPLALDEQASAYWTFGTMWLHEQGLLKPDQDLDFILYNFLRKAMGDVRPRDAEGRCLNKNGSISKKQPPPYFRREQVMRGHAEREMVFKRALNEFREMQMVRDGKLAVYKAPGRHCTFCPFRDLCEVHETQSDWQAIRQEMFTTWNPYEAHEGIK